jgi:hypothetical protein
VPPPPLPPSEPAGDPGAEPDRWRAARGDPDGDRRGDPARDPGLAARRTRLAWTRTTLAFAAVGGVILKTSVPAGLAVLATCPLVWAAGRLGGPSPRPGAADGPARFVRRFRLITFTIVVVALVALAVSVFARGRPA